MNKIWVLLFISIFLSATAIAHPASVSAQPPKAIIVPDDFATIQAAIDNASAGDTIFVRSGTYDQNLTVDKPINLIGQNAQATILTMPLYYENFAAPNTYTINIEADNVNICNFTVKNPNADGTGINSNGDNNQISDVIMNSGELVGIDVEGSDQYITQNEFVNVLTAVQTGVSSSDNQIVGNAFSGCGVIVSGNNNVLSDNDEISLQLTNSAGAVIENNTVNGNFYLTNADSNIIYNNLINGPLELSDGLNNLVVRNTIEDSTAWGILMSYGSNNTFYGNLVTEDTYALAIGGIDITVGSNLFYYNMFINNQNEIATNWQILGSTSFDNGSVGNYWSDYQSKYPNATEVANSGVWNTPYLVYGNDTDNYPLTSPFNISTVSIQLPTWLNQLPSQQPTPTFPPQTVAVNAQTSPSPTSPTPTIPEIAPVTIIPLMLILLLATITLRHRKPAMLRHLSV